MLAGGWIELAGRREVRDARAVAERPNVLMPFDLQRRLDLDPAALVEREAEALVHRIRAHPSGPHHSAREDVIAVREHCSVGLDRVERRVDADVDAAAGELARSVPAQAPRNLREDRRRRIDEHPMLRRLS